VSPSASRLTDAELVARGLEAALEAIGAPAFVSHANGKVSHASASARALLDRDGADTCARVRSAIAHRADYTFVAELRGRSAQPSYLVVLRDSHRLLDVHVREATRRWKLTARECDVLRGLVEGDLGKVIAARLGIHPGSVERHVTAILRKSSSDTRGRLLAKFWMPTPV
jgi:DNA-binding NarL/FixJ family response regulator